MKKKQSIAKVPTKEKSPSKKKICSFCEPREIPVSFLDPVVTKIDVAGTSITLYAEALDVCSKCGRMLRKTKADWIYEIDHDTNDDLIHLMSVRNYEIGFSENLNINEKSKRKAIIFRLYLLCSCGWRGEFVNSFDIEKLKPIYKTVEGY